MSVYTPLDLNQVRSFAKNYGLNIIDLQPIQGGIENTNYFLSTDDQQHFVLTVFEELDQHAAAELFPVLKHLGQSGLPVAVPLSHHAQAIHIIADKPAQIAPRLQGTHPIPCNIIQVKNMGKALAQLHLALQDFPLIRESNHGQAWWQNTAQQLQQSMSNDDKNLLADVFKTLQQLQQRYPNRPTGLIHADLFRDNSLFVDDQLTGILDFSELNNDELLFDISISLNDFCSDFPSVALNYEKAQAFIQAYQDIRRLTDDEKACLNIYLAMAACRFWLSRLQVAQRNQQEGRTGTDILQKDPDEMRRMLINRLAQEYVW